MARGRALLTGLIGGAIAGAVAGLMLAPKAGKEAREIVREKGGEYLNKGEGYISALRERIGRGGDSEEIAEGDKAREDQRGSEEEHRS